VCQRNCWGLMLAVPHARERAGGKSALLLSLADFYQVARGVIIQASQPLQPACSSRANRNTGCLTPQAAQRRRAPEKAAAFNFSLCGSASQRHLICMRRQHVCRKALFAQAEKNFQHSRQYWFSIKRSECIQLKGSSLSLSFARSFVRRREPNQTGVLMNSISPVSQSGLSCWPPVSLFRAHSFRPGAVMMRPFVDSRR
jgi:hypothetical protein